MPVFLRTENNEDAVAKYLRSLVGSEAGDVGEYH